MADGNRTPTKQPPYSYPDDADLCAAEDALAEALDENIGDAKDTVWVDTLPEDDGNFATPDATHGIFIPKTTETPRQPSSVTVAMGLLSQREYDGLSPRVRTMVETSTQRLREQYGDEWLRRERSRLREELSFFHGA